MSRALCVPEQKNHPLLAVGTRTVPQWAEAYADEGSWCPEGQKSTAAIKFSFSPYLPAGVIGATYHLTASSLWWYCGERQLVKRHRYQLFLRFFGTVAERLGLSSWSPDGRGVPGDPPPPDVYPGDVFLEDGRLQDYLSWAASYAPRSPAAYDPWKLVRRRETPTLRSGRQQVIDGVYSVGWRDERRERCTAVDASSSVLSGISLPALRSR